MFDIGHLAGDLTPIGVRRDASLLERFPADDVAFEIEVIVGFGTYGGDLL